MTNPVAKESEREDGAISESQGEPTGGKSVSDDAKERATHVQPKIRGSLTAAICFLLLVPASLTLFSGDPTNPSFAGLAMAVVSLIVSFWTLRRASFVGKLHAMLLFALAAVTFFSNPIGLAPNEGTPFLVAAVYYLVARAGGAAILSLIALGALCRATGAPTEGRSKSFLPPF